MPSLRFHATLAVVALALLQGCALAVRGQRLPEHALHPNPADFQAPPDVAVMHYYGAGGWGIEWRGNYILAAPYFSNHTIGRLLASRASERFPLTPNVPAVRAGFAGTPVEKTNVILIGHGHIDHAGDVPAFFGDGLITGKPVLIADRSTTNMLAPMNDKFSCIAPIDYGDEDMATHCKIPNVRITPIHHAHAPHLNLVGLDVAAFGGFVKTPQKKLPERSAEFKLGNTWAYLIDLLDDRGEIMFRIHYVDAASSPPHGLVMDAKLLAQRDVDVHVACVPGFEESEEYPDVVLRHHNVRYVLAGHWEDFFQPRSDPLTPLRQVLDAEGISDFTKIVETALPQPRGVAPLNKSEKDCAEPHECGPHGPTWTLPIPGETFQFATGPQAPVERLADPVDLPK